MLAAIMSNPDLGEVFFLVALILFSIAFLIDMFNRPEPEVRYVRPLALAGLACLAFAFLAL